MEQKNTNREKGVLDLLLSQVQNFKSCSKFKDMMDFCIRFRKMAPYNAMLLEAQMPSAKYVLTAAEWKKRFNRQPKAEARPLLTLIPFGPIEFLYEIGDVEPCNMSDEEEKPSASCSDMTDDAILEEFEKENEKYQNSNKADQMLENLKKNMIADGIQYIDTRTGIELSSTIKPFYQKYGQSYPLDINYPVSCHIHFRIMCRQNAAKEEKVAYICHELGHLFCHHLSNKTSPKKWWQTRLTGASKEVEREFEAEAAAWLVCNRMGIKTDSAEYLSGYYHKNQTIPNISVDIVLKAAMEIEKRVRGHMNPKDGLLCANGRDFKLALDRIRSKMKEDKRHDKR